MDRKKLLGVLILFLYSVTFAMAGASDNKANCPFAKMAGEWRGTAKCADRNCKDQILKLVLIFNGDKTVTGKIGNLKITKAKGSELKGTARRIMKGDFALSGELEGTLLPSEGSKKYVFAVFFSLKDNQIEGEIFSQGVVGSQQEKITNVSWRIMDMNKFSLQ